MRHGKTEMINELESIRALGLSVGDKRRHMRRLKMRNVGVHFET